MSQFAGLIEHGKEVLGSLLPSFFDRKKAVEELKRQEADLQEALFTVESIGWRCVIDVYLQHRIVLTKADIEGMANEPESNAMKIRAAKARLSELEGLRNLIPAIKAAYPQIKGRIAELTQGDNRTA